MRILISMFLIFVIMVTLEIYSFAWVYSKIGFIGAVVIILGTGIVGAFIAKENAKDALRQLLKGEKKNTAPAKQMFNAVAFFVAAGLLIVPGIITDIAGLLLLLPLTRTVIYNRLIRNHKADRQFSEGFKTGKNVRENTLDSDSVIDIKAEEVNE